ncbi:hypothetical protein PFISCL1PPCAC_17968, partial [Pristionchus fissidentatus]
PTHCPMVSGDDLDVAARSMTLESLPKENLYQILSKLGLRDRKPVRQCSKRMKDAIEQSDLSVGRIELIFNKTNRNFFDVKLDLFDGDDNLSTEKIKKWLSELGQSPFFRRLKADELSITCHKENVSEKVAQNVTALIDFESISVRFMGRMQPGVLNFARLSGKKFESLALYYFSLDSKNILALPSMRSLSLYATTTTKGFSDDELLEIVGVKHKRLLLSANLSELTTLHHLIEEIRSSVVPREITINVDEDYWVRFLASIDLREEGNRLVDFSDPTSHDPCLEFDSWFRYFLDTDTIYLGSHGSSGKRNVLISNMRKEMTGRPLCSLSLSRLIS